MYMTNDEKWEKRFDPAGWRQRKEDERYKVAGNDRIEALEEVIWQIADSRPQHQYNPAPLSSRSLNGHAPLPDEPDVQPANIMEWDVIMIPVITNKGGLHTFSFTDIETTITIDRLRTGANGLKGVLTVEQHGVPIHRSNIDLMSISSRDATRRRLQKKRPSPGAEYSWDTLIELACVTVDNQWGAADPVTDLGEILPGEGRGVKWLLHPFLVEGEVNILYGAPGSGKTYMALALACSVGCQSAYFLDATPYSQTNVLYLDWEQSRETINTRMFQLMGPTGLTDYPPIGYKRMAGPITRHFTSIQKEVENRNARLVIVDSISPAAGGKTMDDEAVEGLAEVLRSLQVTTLLIGQIAKEDTGIRGSLMWEYMARNAWQLHGEKDENQLHISLTHKKSTHSSLQPSMAYDLIIEEGSAKFQRSGRLGADALGKMSIADRLDYTLKDNGPVSIADLAEMLDTGTATIRVDIEPA